MSVLSFTGNGCSGRTSSANSEESDSTDSVSFPTADQSVISLLEEEEPSTEHSTSSGSCRCCCCCCCRRSGCSREILAPPGGRKASFPLSGGTEMFLPAPGGCRFCDEVQSWPCCSRNTFRIGSPDPQQHRMGTTDRHVIDGCAPVRNFCCCEPLPVGINDPVSVQDDRITASVFPLEFPNYCHYCGRGWQSPGGYTDGEYHGGDDDVTGCKRTRPVCCPIPQKLRASDAVGPPAKGALLPAIMAARDPSLSSSLDVSISYVESCLAFNSNVLDSIAKRKSEEAEAMKAILGSVDRRQLDDSIYSRLLRSCHRDTATNPPRDPRAQTSSSSSCLLRRLQDRTAGGGGFFEGGELADELLRRQHRSLQCTGAGTGSDADCGCCWAGASSCDGVAENWPRKAGDFLDAAKRREITLSMATSPSGNRSVSRAGRSGNFNHVIFGDNEKVTVEPPSCRPKRRGFGGMSCSKETIVSTSRETFKSRSVIFNGQDCFEQGQVLGGSCPLLRRRTPRNTRSDETPVSTSTTTTTTTTTGCVSKTVSQSTGFERGTACRPKCTGHRTAKTKLKTSLHCPSTRPLHRAQTLLCEDLKGDFHRPKPLDAHRYQSCERGDCDDDPIDCRAVELPCMRPRYGPVPSVAVGHEVCTGHGSPLVAFAPSRAAVSFEDDCGIRRNRLQSTTCRSRNLEETVDCPCVFDSAGGGCVCPVPSIRRSKALTVRCCSSLGFAWPSIPCFVQQEEEACSEVFSSCFTVCDSVRPCDSIKSSASSRTPSETLGFPKSRKLTPMGKRAKQRTKKKRAGQCKKENCAEFKRDGKTTKHLIWKPIWQKHGETKMEKRCESKKVRHKKKKKKCGGEYEECRECEKFQECEVCEECEPTDEDGCRGVSDPAELLANITPLESCEPGEPFGPCEPCEPCSPCDRSAQSDPCHSLELSPSCRPWSTDGVSGTAPTAVPDLGPRLRRRNCTCEGWCLLGRDAKNALLRGLHPSTPDHPKAPRQGQLSPEDDDVDGGASCDCWSPDRRSIADCAASFFPTVSSVCFTAPGRCGGGSWGRRRRRGPAGPARRVDSFMRCLERPEGGRGGGVDEGDGNDPSTNRILYGDGLSTEEIIEKLYVNELMSAIKKTTERFAKNVLARRNL